jgi:hypothetical protein
VIRGAFRWTIAVTVTIAAFAAVTWICGALVLTIHDASVKWGIAGGLGVAVAALAALWGHSYATGESPHAEPQTESEPGGAAGPNSTATPDGGGTIRNTIRGGNFWQTVIQGRDFGSVAVSKRESGAQPPRPGSPSAPGNGGTRNTINHGIFHGPVIQGRDFGIVDLNDPAPYSNPPFSRGEESGRE